MHIFLLNTDIFNNYISITLIHFKQIIIQEFSYYHYYKSVYANVQLKLCAKRLHGH